MYITTCTFQDARSYVLAVVTDWKEETSSKNHDSYSNENILKTVVANGEAASKAKKNESF